MITETGIVAKKSTVLNIRELKPGFGAEALDIKIGSSSPPELAALVSAFHQHGALLIRNQQMKPQELESFMRLFGELEEHTLKENCLAEHPYIYILSNRKVNGKLIGAHNDGIG